MKLIRVLYCRYLAVSFESIDSTVCDNGEECRTGERKLFKGATKRVDLSYLIS